MQTAAKASNLTVDQHVQFDTEANETDITNPPTVARYYIQRQPLPDGGWVATHEDVTEQKRGERLLAEKAAEFEAINDALRRRAQPHVAGILHVQRGAEGRRFERALW